MKSSHIYLSIAGTMGSGKTTVAKLLAKQLSRYHLIEENFGDNAFLPRFYDDMDRWAFHSQTFFLMEKISQMMSTKKLLQTSNVIQDTPIQQDVFSYAYAQHILGHMDLSEWKLYQKVYHSFEPYLPTPDIIIYLDASVTTLVQRIGSRGRSYEDEIPLTYVKLLDRLNHDWIKQTKLHIYKIQTNGLDIIHSAKARDTFFHQLMPLI